MKKNSRNVSRSITRNTSINKTLSTVTFLLLFGSAPAHSAVLNYSFTGVIDSYSYNSAFGSDPFSGNLTIGTAFSGAIESNQTGASVSSISPYYKFVSGGASATINAGVESFNNAPETLIPGDKLSEHSAVRVANDAAIGDYYNFLMFSDYLNPSRASPELDGVPSSLVTTAYDSFRRGLSIELTDSDGTVFNSSDLPTALPDLSEFETARFRWYTEISQYTNVCDEAGCSLILRSVGVYEFSGDLTSLTTVPLPAAFYLFGTGLLGLFGLARRKKFL